MGAMSRMPRWLDALTGDELRTWLRIQTQGYIHLP